MLVEKFDRLRSVGGLVQSGTALVLVAELGPDFAERFSTARHFDLWLGLCPDNRITGGKIMSSATRDVKSRAATALRLAAQGLHKAQNYFGDLYRRWKPRNAQGHHRHGAQTGAGALASVQIPRSLQPRSFQAGGRKNATQETGPPPQYRCCPRPQTHPSSMTCTVSLSGGCRVLLSHEQTYDVAIPILAATWPSVRFFSIRLNLIQSPAVLYSISIL